ncbi:MAG TPA: nucleotide disphospho-sugar-binding domain-containing protein [Solirubrobacteraceae bacterium]|nr:nucleotide disphospho-sugar-binding domain-containing protein [Solirubrobacteraceae bacterium]
MPAEPPARRLRVLLGAFGDPGHAFPMIGLGRALRARGHDVTVQTWSRWQADVEREGMSFSPAPEYHVFPTMNRPLKPYEAVVRAAREAGPVIEALRPDVIVADILTLAPALAGELAGVRVATLIPHVHPSSPPGFPAYSAGARLPRTAAGRALWRALERPLRVGLEQGRRELNETRRRLGLPPQAHHHGGISRQLCLVGTFPALEYPRGWEAHEHVVGPLLWQPPSGETAVPEGPEPLVVVAPSTSQDPDQSLLRAALSGLDGLPLRVLGTWNRRPPGRPLPSPGNALVLEWLSYAQTMPGAAVVVCHGGHGTVARALSCGAAVVACPSAGDMNENAARVDWAGVGVRVPRRLVGPLSVRLAVLRALGDPALRSRAAGFAASGVAAGAGARAAVLVEGLAARGR